MSKFYFKKENAFNLHWLMPEAGFRHSHPHLWFNSHFGGV